MPEKIYATELSDAEWATLAPLLEPPTRRPRKHASC
jgi:transposase